VSNKKARLSAVQARLSAAQATTKNTTPPVSDVTFKGGLRNMNLKYAHTHFAFKPLDTWCEIVLIAVGGVWVRACAGNKNADLRLSGCTIRAIRNILQQHIGDEELLYVMNAYIYGVINTASLSDALCITLDYENYISSANTLTATQKKILLKGFRGFTKRRIFTTSGKG